MVKYNLFAIEFRFLVGKILEHSNDNFLESQVQIKRPLKISELFYLVPIWYSFIPVWHPWFGKTSNPVILYNLALYRIV